MTVVKKSQVEGTFKLGLANAGQVDSADNTIEVHTAEQLSEPHNTVPDKHSLLWLQAYDEGYLQGGIEAKERLEAEHLARCAELKRKTDELASIELRYRDDLAELPQVLAKLQKQISSYKGDLVQRSIEMTACALRDLLQLNLLTQEGIVALVKKVMATQGLTPGCQLYGGEKIQSLLTGQLEWEVIKDCNLADFEVEIRQTPCYTNIDVERYLDELKAGLATLIAGERHE